METELKFQVPPAQRVALHRAVATAAAQTTQLQAVYADTADLRLARAGLALRLRKEGRVWVQTLKGRGDGLMQRLEHEIPLPAQRGTPTLDPARHAGSAVGERLAALLADGSTLQPLYRTDIQRLHRRVRWQGATIEIAYDRGRLLAAGRHAEVDEIEFELISGPPAALTSMALRWAGRHALWWDCRTKSERGTRLALDLQTVPPVGAQALSWPVDARPAQVFQAALTAALAQALPNAAELASGSGSPEHLHQLRLALRRLRSTLRLWPDWAGWAGGEDAARALDAAWREPFGRLGAVRDAQLQGRAPPFDAGEIVRGAGFTALLLQSQGLALQPETTPDAPADLRGIARASLREAWSACARDASRFKHADAARQHRARKRLKRFRHGLEVLAPVLKPGSTQRLLAATQAALDALGRLRDRQLAGAPAAKDWHASLQALQRLQRARPRWLRS